MFQIFRKKRLWLKKLKVLCRGHMFLVVLQVNKLLELFMKQNCKKNQTKFRVEKVIKGKDNKLYIKWKCYYSSFNSWIDQKVSFQNNTTIAKAKQKLTYICLIMQQMLIHQNLLKRLMLISLKRWWIRYW